MSVPTLVLNLEHDQFQVSAWSTSTNNGLHMVDFRQYASRIKISGLPRALSDTTYKTLNLPMNLLLVLKPLRQVLSEIAEYCVLSPVGSTHSGRQDHGDLVRKAFLYSDHYDRRLVDDIDGLKKVRNLTAYSTHSNTI